MISRVEYKSHNEFASFIYVRHIFCIIIKFMNYVKLWLVFTWSISYCLVKNTRMYVRFFVISDELKSSRGQWETRRKNMKSSLLLLSQQQHGLEHHGFVSLLSSTSRRWFEEPSFSVREFCSIWVIYGRIYMRHFNLENFGHFLWRLFIGEQRNAFLFRMWQCILSLSIKLQVIWSAFEKKAGKYQKWFKSSWFCLSL